MLSVPKGSPIAWLGFNMLSDYMGNRAQTADLSRVVRDRRCLFLTPGNAGFSLLDDAADVGGKVEAAEVRGAELPCKLERGGIPLNKLSDDLRSRQLTPATATSEIEVLRQVEIPMGQPAWSSKASVAVHRRL